METTFTQLNHGWNAQPNAPFPEVRVDGDTVTLEFSANPYQYPSFTDGQRLRLVFRRVWRYGLSSVNDEGWYMGQCRFSGIAPAWGEFYEVSGDLRLEECKIEWKNVTQEPGADYRHYLFYLRDGTFECDAISWELIT
jgi:hypothetical protein